MEEKKVRPLLKQAREKAKEMVLEFQHEHFNCSYAVAKDMAIKTIGQIQETLCYYPLQDRYGFNWITFYELVKKEIAKM